MELQNRAFHTKNILLVRHFYFAVFLAGLHLREQAGHIPGVAAAADLPAWNGRNVRWWEYARAAG